MKQYINVMLAAAMLVTLAGCSDKAEEEKSSAPSAEVQQTEYVMQEGDYQVTGEVTSIVGNEVTLALGDVTETKSGFGQAPDNGELPENADGEEAESGTESGKKAGRGEKPDMSGFENEEMPDRSNFGGGEKPDMSGFEGGEMPDRSNFGGSGKSSAEITKSGETGVYIIPYGMTITGKSKNGDYTSITEGTILRLTITSEGYVAAAEIL